MNRIFTSRSVAAAAAVVFAFTTAAVRADSIGVNFEGKNNITVTSSAGVVAQSDWNNETGKSGNTTSIKLSDGSLLSGAKLTWSTCDAWDTGATATNQNGDLLKGYLDDRPGSDTSISLTLPSAYQNIPYSVYLYIAGDTAGRGGIYTVNSQTATLVNSGPQGNGNFILADSTGTTRGNYYVFTGLQGDLSIATNPTISNTIYASSARSPVDGFQVVFTPSAVPLPAALPSGLLLLAGLSGLAFLRRKIA